jgi:hypothetical protein
MIAVAGDAAWIQREPRACAAWVVAAFATLGSMMIGCDTGTHYSLRDTEQSVYRTSCWEGRCRPTLTAPTEARPAPPCAAGERAAMVLAGAYVVSACHACVRAEQTVTRHDLARCRAIVCEHPRDCPPWHRGRSVECRQGLCVERGSPREERPLDAVSSAALCMAGAGPSSGDRFTLAEDRLAFARAACDAQGRCAQPSGCRAAPF